MKTKLIFAAMFIGAIVFTGCQKEPIVSSGKSNLNTTSENQSAKAKIAMFDMNKYSQLLVVNKSRLALLEGQLKRGAMQSITVPTDYATIQEAVDAASEGANIFVNSGTYNEDVVISTAGLKLQARDNVLLNGRFTLVEGANNVTIKKFNIHIPDLWTDAIVGIGITGGQFVQNTITAEPANYTYDQNSMIFVSCNGVTVRDNTITGPDWAIVVFSYAGIGNGTSNNNTISNNTMSGNFIVGIQVQGNSQHNTVSNNIVSEGSEADFANGGIYIFGIPDYLEVPEEIQGECNNNIVKNNNCTLGNVGIGLLFNAYNNTIGPNNTMKNNYEYGIWLYSGTSDNNIFNNTALNNVVCDIVVQDDGVPCLNNTFSHNNYGCFTEE